jgi:Tfp pilus assembly protein FimT
VSAGPADRGLALTELSAVLALLAIGCALGLPALAQARSRAAAGAGARLLATSCQGLRWKSVSRGRAHGLLFERDGRGWRWREVADGNGNGLRTAEVAAGVDPTLSPPRRLEDTLAPATLGFPSWSTVPRIPPQVGNLEDLDDPIRIGNTDLLAFSPLGTSTSGTLYVTDGHDQLYALVLFGATGRLRVWRFDLQESRWKAS